MAIALGGGAVTGATALLASWLRGRQEGRQLERRLDHEREQQARELAAAEAEQWRERLVQAADDFSTDVLRALHVIRDALPAAEDPPSPEAVALSTAAVDRVHAHRARVQLLFGAESACGELAAQALSSLRDANILLREADRDVRAPAMGSAIIAADHAHRDFAREALTAIRALGS